MLRQFWFTNPIYCSLMRISLLIAGLALAGGMQSVAAQSSRATAQSSRDSQARLATSKRAETREQPLRLACAPLIGKVYEPNGEPLVGATLLVKGTHQVYVTDSEGKFQLTDAIYQGQKLTVGAAGYRSQDVALNDCDLPRLVLEKSPSARIKRSGKRAGQVVRLDNRSTNMR